MNTDSWYLRFDFLLKQNAGVLGQRDVVLAQFPCKLQLFSLFCWDLHLLKLVLLQRVEDYMKA